MCFVQIFKHNFNPTNKSSLSFLSHIGFYIYFYRQLSILSSCFFFSQSSRLDSGQPPLCYVEKNAALLILLSAIVHANSMQQPNLTFVSCLSCQFRMSGSLLCHSQRRWRTLNSSQCENYIINAVKHKTQSNVQCQIKEMANGTNLWKKKTVVVN